MKKKIIISLIIATGLFLCVKESAQAWLFHNLVDKLSGYIEVVEDWSIERINLPSKEVQEILRKSTGYIIYDFDLSPDGKTRVFTVHEDVPSSDCSDPGFSKILLYSSNTNTVILKKKSGISTPTFSPDGRKIAYLLHVNDPSEDKMNGQVDLYIINVDGTNDKKVSNMPLDHFRPAWFPDSKRLAVTTRDMAIYVIDSDSAEHKKVIDFGVAPSVSHDGKKIAYLSNTVDAKMRKRIIDNQNIKKSVYNKKIQEMTEREKRQESIEMHEYYAKHFIALYDLQKNANCMVVEVSYIDEPAVWSPDDKYIAYGDRSWETRSIYVADVATGKNEKIRGRYGRVQVWH